MEQVNIDLAAAATKVTHTPTEAKQLLDIIATITDNGQVADASTPTPPQQTPGQPSCTSPRQSSKRKSSTSRGTVTATSTELK